MKNIIKARIRRNMLDQLSGTYYRDENSDIIRHLNSNRKNALLGIQKGGGMYTIIGVEKVYYNNIPVRISLSNESIMRNVIMSYLIDGSDTIRNNPGVNLFDFD